MFTSTLRKLIVIPIGVLLLALFIGAGTALAARAHQEPALSAHQSSLVMQPLSQTGREQEIVGTVQSIDQTRQTFSLLPTGQSKATTIAYDTHTNIHHNDQMSQLAPGMSIDAHVMMHDNGMMYATEIESGTTHWNGTPTGMMPYRSFPHGTCDETGPHGPGYNR